MAGAWSRARPAIQPANVQVVFTRARPPATATTGGDDPPQLGAYDVANTDFFADLNKFIPGEAQRLQGDRPDGRDQRRASRWTASTRWSLADEPLPGYTGPYGPPLSGTTPADVPIESSPTVPGGYGFEGVYVRKPGTVRRDRPFEIKAGEAAAGADGAHRLGARPTTSTCTSTPSTRTARSSRSARRPARSSRRSPRRSTSTRTRAGQVQALRRQLRRGGPDYAGKITFRPAARPHRADTGAFTPAEKDVWFAKLEEFVPRRRQPRAHRRRAARARPR